jgi:hypothetical protein
MNFIKEFVDSVLIIDDEKKDILKLKESLETQDVWVTHCFPEELINESPIRHRTLLFMDLYLEDTADIKSVLSKYTRPILQKHFSNSRAYGIVIWSLHDDEISTFCEKIAEDTIHQKIYAPPIFIISLDKSRYLRTNDFSHIIDDLNEKLLESPAASFFMSWSISVTRALTNVVSDFFSLSPDFEDKEKKILRNLYLLAKNYTGLPDDQIADYPLYQDVYKAFNELIYSSLIYQQKNNFIDIFKNYEHSEEVDFSEEIMNFAKINEKYFIESILINNQNYIIPGSIFEIAGKNRIIRKLQFLNNFSRKSHFCRASAQKNARPVRKSTGFPNRSNNFLLVPDRPPAAKSIAIELTPPCDFSHKKLNSKLVGGFIIELPSEEKKVRELTEKFKKASFYPIWPVLAGTNRPQLMCFDFRCLLTVHDTDLKKSRKYKIILKAKYPLFSDILQKFSSYSARLGIASLMPKI